MPNNELQYMEELLHRMSVLHDDLLGPVREHGVAVLHALRHGRREDLQRGAHHRARLHRVRLQQAVEHWTNQQHIIMCL